jgi:hypothetical protein
MLHYLHENIVHDDAKGETKLIKNNKTVKVSQSNWHKLLHVIGWSKFPLSFIKYLNTYSDSKNKNSPFGVLDCGSSGECLFCCIAHSLSSNFETYYDYKDIRESIAQSIDEETFVSIIETYRVLKDSEDFDEDWDPYEINDKEELQLLIREGGQNYWGDHILLQLLIKTFQINILILKMNTYQNTHGIYPFYNEYNKEFPTIMLLYEDGNHFKLVGYFKNYMRCILNHEDIPSEIKRIYSIV